MCTAPKGGEGREGGDYGPADGLPLRHPLGTLRHHHFRQQKEVRHSFQVILLNFFTIFTVCEKIVFLTNSACCFSSLNENSVLRVNLFAQEQTRYNVEKKKNVSKKMKETFIKVFL